MSQKRYYRLSNISGQRVTLNIVTKDGQNVEDYLEEGEIVYGLSGDAVEQLKFYELIGLIKVDETEYMEDPKIRWLVEGF